MKRIAVLALILTIVGAAMAVERNPQGQKSPVAREDDATDAQMQPFLDLGTEYQRSKASERPMTRDEFRNRWQELEAKRGAPPWEKLVRRPAPIGRSADPGAPPASDIQDFPY